MSVESIPPKPVDFTTIDEAIQAYVDMRVQLRAHVKAATDKENEMKEFLDQVSMWLRDMGDKFGVDNFKTAHGTAYRNLKKKYRIADWDTFIDYVADSGNFQLLEKRVAKNAVVEIHKDTHEVPPGLEYLEEVEFNVLSPTKKKSKAGEAEVDLAIESDTW